MTAAGGDRAIEIVAANSSPTALGLDIPNINERTGLSTDYLNHFTEASMILDLVVSMPDCLEDLRAWQPRTYIEHFANSHFRNSEFIIRLYEAADPAVREALDETSQALNTALLETREALLESIATSAASEIAQSAQLRLRPLIARAGAVINGGANEETQSNGSLQAAIDAIFTR